MEKTITNRINSIDILRGIVMIIMALDHTRDYFHVTAMTASPLDPATSTVPLFFTRWITHFCAPTFVFLSGISAFLASLKKTKKEASNFLIIRGLWLVFVELAIVTLGITFNPLYSFIILQVIWAIGWSMIILGLLMRTSFTVILVTGIVLTLGHNLLDHVLFKGNPFALNFIKITLTSAGNVIPVGQSHFIGVFYTILPWTGLMLLGYCAGLWFHKDFDAVKRRKLLLFTGLGLVVLFIVLRAGGLYGNPTTWNHKYLISFLDVSKYPPSLQYMCMTIGPALIFLSLIENAKGKFIDFVTIYGRVPFFYYILHFYLLHIVLLIVFFASGHTTSQIVDMQSPFLFRPTQFGYSLPIVYLIWISVVLFLYIPCRWYNQYKATHNQWCLRYI